MDPTVTGPLLYQMLLKQRAELKELVDELSQFAVKRVPTKSGNPLHGDDGRFVKKEESAAKTKFKVDKRFSSLIPKLLKDPNVSPEEKLDLINKSAIPEINRKIDIISHTLAGFKKKAADATKINEQEYEEVKGNIAKGVANGTLNKTKAETYLKLLKKTRAEEVKNIGKGHIKTLTDERKYRRKERTELRRIVGELQKIAKV